jgi:3D (Asp-Asp-Asp) domain-containing protein
LKIGRFGAAVFTALFFLTRVAYAQEDPSTAAQSAVQTVVQATVTGYANGADGGAVGSMTATGVRTHWGTVAADWRLYPPGTRMQIEGFPDDIFTVEDTGGGVRGNIVDIWFPELATAAAFGTKSLRVTVLANPDK